MTGAAEATPPFLKFLFSKLILYYPVSAMPGVIYNLKSTPTVPNFQHHQKTAKNGESS